MDFELVLKTLAVELNRHRIRYGVMEGFAVGILGAPRMTADLDLLVHRDDLPALHGALSRLGYERAAHLENTSHYHHPVHALGGIDVVHAFRKYALAMLDRAQPHTLFGGTHTLHVLQAEDVIGLKVQAIANDPSRRAHEQADIEALMSIHGPRLDWDRIQEFYDLFDMGDEARRLRARFDHAQ